APASAAPSSAAPATVSVPTSTTVVASGSSGTAASSVGAAVSANATSFPTATVLGPPGLIALSVAPVGSLNGNGGPFAPASAQVAFTLPSQSQSAPTLGEAILQMVTATQVLDFGNPDGPADSPAEASSLDAG